MTPAPAADSAPRAPLLSTVASLRVGLDLPSELFAILTSHLKATKAAFLMPDENGATLVPWVYHGIDRTTQHHLRINREFLESLPGYGDGTSITVAGDALLPLKPYFSSREFALVRRLRITPFIAADQISAALLIVESESAPTSESVDLGTVEEAAPAIAAKINGARAILGNGATETRDAALRARLSNIFSEAESAGMHVTAGRVDLDRLARELMRNTTTADIYRFKRDLSGALNTMVSGSGELLSLGEHAVLLIVQSKNPYSERLLAHQFAEGVRTLVNDSPPLKDLTDRTWRYPGGGASIDEVIDSILE